MADDLSEAYAQGYLKRAMVVLAGATGLPLAKVPIDNALDGMSANALFTPTAAAYTAGNTMDVAKQIAFVDRNGVAVPAASTIRILSASLKIDQTALQASEGAYTLHFYSVTPPSALANNAAWTLASADLTAYRGSISLGTPVDLGAACFVKAPNLDFDIKLDTGLSTLYATLVSVAGFTATVVARRVDLVATVI